MRGAGRALLRGFSLPARPPWGYGLLCGVAIALPLLIGTLTGHPHDGGLVALGAYFTAFGDAYGKPYGTRARKLAVQVVLIAAGFWFGSLLAPYPWWAVAGIGLVAAAGSQWRVVGLPPVLAAVVGFYDALPVALSPPLLVGAGGVFFMAVALALWPVRRLAPLNEALAKACTAIAGMLDGLDLPEEEWAQRRQRGSKALDAVATASAAFHSAEDKEHAPDTYLRALTRIFHESVALRALKTDSGADLDEPVTALSTALREAAAGSVVGVPGALAATAAFAEHVAGMRAVQRTDPDSLRTVALLGQVRRCLDRIAAAVRTVGLLSAEGIEAPVRLPRFSWQVGALMKAPEHAGRVGLAVAAAMAMMLVVHEHYGKWFIFTVLLGLRSTYGDTVDRVVLRVAGTVFGALLAAVALAVVPGHFTLAVLVLVFGTLGFALREVSYGYWSIFATPLALMLTDFSVSLDWRAAGIRVIMTAGGGVVALVAARLLWPRGEAIRIPGLVVDLLTEHAALVRALAEHDLDAVPERTDAAGRAADGLNDSLDRLDKEPSGSAPAPLREAVTLARKVRDDAMLLSAVMRGGKAGWEATSAMLDTVADRLDEVAHAVLDERPPPAAGELDGLDELAGRVDVLMEEAATGEVSAVRAELRHAIAAQPALSTLCSDALELARQTGSSASAASISSREMPSK